MLKKVSAFVLVFALLVCFAVPALAAAEDIVLRYVLDVDGNSTVSAETGDIITVQYSVENTNENANALTSTTQNQIRYDHTFFELVHDSVKETDGGSAFSVSTPVDSDGTHYIYFNSILNVRLNKGTKKTIGEFKLKVIGTAGTSYVENTECFATDSSASLFASDKTDLAVTVAGDSLVSITDIKLNKSAVNLESGATERLTATISPENATNRNVMWTSSDPTVAAVDSEGFITTKNAGEATITATTQDGGKTAVCAVTVTKTEEEPAETRPAAVTGVRLNKTAAALKVGKTETLTATVIPSDAANKTVRWSSSNTVVATVSASGVVTAKSEGVAAVTATTEDGGKTAICNVTVTKEETPETPSENAFLDVESGSYYYDAVEWAAKNNITNGTGAATFSPNGPVTRGQVVTFLWRAAGSPAASHTAAQFKDLDADKYYVRAVEWAVEQGITNGTGEKTFSPDAVCTRGQIVTFLARFAGVRDAVTQSVFGDVKSTDYFAAAVKWAKDNGVTSGTSATTFSPNADCTRGQIVTFLYRWMVR